jgi:hypothetical protein
MSKDPGIATDSQSARLAVIAAASKMLAGEMDLLEGCRTILRYRGQLGDRTAALFLTLEGVDSETDDLPMGRARDAWDADALERKDREKEEYLRRAKGPLLEACRTIISALSD